MDIVGLGYLGLESPRSSEWAEYGPQVLGLGLAPSPIYPWWRWQATLAYAIYAVIGVLVMVMRRGEAGS